MQLKKANARTNATTSLKVQRERERKRDKLFRKKFDQKQIFWEKVQSKTDYF